MSMQVKAGYTNPLTMVNHKRWNLGAAQKAGKKDGGSDRVKELQAKQQQLQSEMLLIKGTGSDTGGASVEKLKKMEERLDEVTSALRKAKAETPDSKEESKLLSSTLRKPDLDTYESGNKLVR